MRMYLVIESGVDPMRMQNGNVSLCAFDSVLEMKFSAITRILRFALIIDLVIGSEKDILVFMLSLQE